MSSNVLNKSVTPIPILFYKWAFVKKFAFEQIPIFPISQYSCEG